VALATHPHIAPRLKKEYSYISTPPLGLRGLFWVTSVYYTCSSCVSYSRPLDMRQSTDSLLGVALEPLCRASIRRKYFCAMVLLRCDHVHFDPKHFSICFYTDSIFGEK
jgi:hypothetical protein